MSFNKNNNIQNENNTLKFNDTPNQRFVPGRSVDEHRDIEAGNILLTGDEIKQQNENL
ncbi:hypothetical protein V7201_03770 [Bacillus sp. JJ1122]|uniref:hypothetical protein n=1 Tax=Bacillus sp. JJ1122 TaxID=3122951 RepID=UPI002FFFB106